MISCGPRTTCGGWQSSLQSTVYTQWNPTRWFVDRTEASKARYCIFQPSYGYKWLLYIYKVHTTCCIRTGMQNTDGYARRFRISLVTYIYVLLYRTCVPLSGGLRREKSALAGTLRILFYVCKTWNATTPGTAQAVGIKHPTYSVLCRDFNHFVQSSRLPLQSKIRQSRYAR